MPAETLQLEVLTREKVLLRTHTAWVTLPAEDGEMGILPQHAPLVSTLDSGVLRCEQQGKTLSVAIHYGYARVDGEKVVVMCKLGELASEIDAQRAQTAEKKALQALQQISSPADTSQAALQQQQLYASKLKRAATRQQAF